ncbi:glutaredoxin domain-containing protein [Poseidonocella sp. HB161398]|uniref:glutaredoxin domain-containing protein n=1 Tax=Poseidonocella sp. HB161398 TaxID=2320855 RepID=UPI003516015E
MAEPSPQAMADLQAAIADPAEPVVIFALEWCEFCWSVRKLFKAAGIPFRSVDLDGPDYRAENRGTEMRKALAQVTGAPTIPQVFIGGTHVGGATETFDAFNDGRLREMLAACGVAMDGTGVGNAYAFLPAWLHPRKPVAA